MATKPSTKKSVQAIQAGIDSRYHELRFLSLSSLDNLAALAKQTLPTGHAPEGTDNLRMWRNWQTRWIKDPVG